MKTSSAVDYEFKAKQLRKPVLVYTDKAGNTLWVKYIKTRDTFQWYAKNNKKELITTEGFAIILARSGLNIGSPVSAKGRKIEKIIKKYR